MPRIVPSQVRELIEQLYPQLISGNPGMQITRFDTTPLAAILKTTDEIPDDLITLSGPEYSRFLSGLETIRYQLGGWQHGSVDPENLPQVQGKNAVRVIYEALKLCPDEFPSPATVALAFIAEPALRDSIRLDIDAADRDLINAEWKGATVLAGAATEALLLWAIQEAEKKSGGAISGAISKIKAAGTLSPVPKAVDIDRWKFIDLIEVASVMGLIKDDTAKQARLGKDFRNLIHPGRVARLGQSCDRGTALAALAAVEFVVRDLN
jgi:hypothetical protein